MADYRAPLREIRFWLSLFTDSVVGNVTGAVSGGAEPRVGVLDDDVADAVLDEAARLAETVLAPLYRLGDRRGAELIDGRVTMPEEIKQAYAQLAGDGWIGLPVDEAYGGQGLPQRLATAVNEIWKSANLSFSLCPMLTQGAIAALHAHASDALRQRFLPQMTSGEWTGTMNLTEPHAGSDLGALSTTATPDGDHYRIRGRKIFITWGDHDLADNIIHLVLARIDGAPDGVNGISMFVVPKFLVNDDGTLGARNEITTVALEEKLGIHGSPTCALNYGESDGAVGYLVGEANAGLKCMFTMMNTARLAVGVEGLAVSERAYQQALSYALERVQGTRADGSQPVAIIEHPDVRRMLLLMRAGCDAMRGISYWVAALIDLASAGNAGADARVSLLTPIVKGWCTEVAQEIASLGVQVHGGVGYIEETGAAQVLRDARITTIYEGTTGIQANDLVGRKILRDRGRALRQLLQDIAASRSELAHDDAMAPINASLTVGLEAAEEVVDALLSRGVDQPAFAGTAAVNTLMLLGTLVAGWSLACAARAAADMRAERSADAAWFDAKIRTARFYAEHFMPRIGAYATTILAGSDTVMSFSASDLQR
jgi:alkylation response protein AidB-like acyl-CoA dehydrogenase